MRPMQHPIIAGLDLFSGAFLLIAIWRGLPARWWPVDAVGTAIAVLFLIAGLGLGLGARWGRRFSIWSGVITLAIGMVVVTILMMTLTYLAGVYGPVGEGGAILYGLIVAILVPYLIIFPAAKIRTLGARR